METNQATGLRLPEVEAARAAHGSNALPQPRGKGFFLRLLENLSDPIIKILLIALAVNMLFLFRGEGWFETAGIALAVILGAALLQQKLLGLDLPQLLPEGALRGAGQLGICLPVWSMVKSSR